MLILLVNVLQPLRKTINDDAFYFEKGFARVKKDNMYGCINSCGTQIIPFLYDFIYDCRRLEMLKKYD